LWGGWDTLNVSQMDLSNRLPQHFVFKLQSDML
jgi:hypothetical protein